MKMIQKAFAVLALIAVACGISHAQTALTQTTLSQSASDGVVRILYLASVTGISPATNNTQTQLYIDHELDDVISVNTTAKTVTVVRGVAGTTAVGHPSGDMVLAGPPQAFSGFDPPLGICANAWLYTPYVNFRTGNQWICSTITLNWVPGFGNVQEEYGTTAAVASAAALLPSGPLFHVTGVTGITSFSIPVGFNATAAGQGRFCYITDSTATTSVGNNIGTAVTGVAGQVSCWYWDAQNSKFYSK